MYKVHLDIHLVFSPLMNDNGDGITMTRELALPFPPTEDIRLYSHAFDAFDEPMGFALKEVVWDLGRQAFLASTHYIHEDYPIAGLAADLEEWAGRGWKLGSYADAYRKEWRPPRNAGMNAKAVELPNTVDDAVYGPLQEQPPVRRPLGTP